MGSILFLYVGKINISVVNAQVVWTKTSAEPGNRKASGTVPMEISFTLDGILISVRSSNLPSSEFTASDPGSISQVASSVTWKPYREFSITAIPFGSKPGTEALPIAGSGLKPIYENTLRNFRLQQGGELQTGSSVSLFDQQIIGLQSLVALHIDGSDTKSILINEWVVEAGERLWIIRTSKEQLPGNISLKTAQKNTDLVISSGNLSIPSTLSLQPEKNSSMELDQNILAIDLPTPPWWQGDCDYTTYYNSSGIGSYRLGAVYLGVPACGPRPWYDSAPDVEVHFFPGSWGVLEWECVEYSMRFLYLKYGTAPYGANGSQVVWKYSGSLLGKVSNKTPGISPQPNDILSYGSTSTSGHTSVVTSSTVDLNGNGTITVIEENAAEFGSDTLVVSNWEVKAFSPVSGWLHANQAPSLPILVQPANNAIGIDIPPKLEVTVSDPDADPLSVTYYGRQAPDFTGQDFRIVVIPDSQNESTSYPAVFNSMTTWIANNKTAQNIVFTTHVGDIVNTSSNTTQWGNADTAMDFLDAGNVSYSVGPGNHDLGGLFNNYFGIDRFSGKSYYGGHYGGDNYNNFSFFSASGMDFILINLQYSPSTAILDWADARLKEYGSRRAIVVSHSILNVNDTFTVEGTNIVNALKDNPNLFLMLCGHMHTSTDGAAYFAQRGDDGHTIYIMLADYQEYPNGGNGYLRILRFSPMDNMIYSTTYSPYINAYITSSPDQLEMTYRMLFEVIGTVNGVPSGSNASFTWPDLVSGNEYEWYADASDIISSTISSIWNFTTLDNTFKIFLPLVIR